MIAFALPSGKNTVKGLHWCCDHSHGEARQSSDSGINESSPSTILFIYVIFLLPKRINYHDEFLI